MKTATHHREPLVHIVKRTDISTKKAVLIRAIAVIVSLLFSALLVFVLKGINPIQFFTALFEGAFGTSRRIWILLQKTAVLLCISLAVTPAFKMRFWNTGAEGQVLVGGLATCACMYYLGGALPLPLLYLLMIVSSIVAGIIWAVIPAVFKAKWNTNETLFTLMMNYVATFLVSFFINTWVTSGSGTLAPMSQYGLPRILNNWLLNIIIVAVLTVAVYIYLRFSKQGYEISVVGESENTARYIGINVKKVIIRTVAISGAICGLVGFMIVAGDKHSIKDSIVGGQGFTAIMVSWMSKFNPIIMIPVSLLIVFLSVGSKYATSAFRIDNSIGDILTAIVIFSIIACEFFTRYKINIRKPKRREKV